LMEKQVADELKTLALQTPTSSRIDKLMKEHNRLVRILKMQQVLERLKLKVMESIDKLTKQIDGEPQALQPTTKRPARDFSSCLVSGNDRPGGSFKRLRPMWRGAF